jgi:cell division protein FtsZ
MDTYEKLMNNRPEAQSIAAKIMVIGVGGAGGNAVDHIYEKGIKGVNLMICNTDIKALNKSPLQSVQKICLGDGKGAGNAAEEGARKANESLDQIREYIEGHNPDMLFVTAGMGGGTGTGASPIVAKIAHEMDIPTVAIVTTPSKSEGPERVAQAAAGIEQLRKYVDSLIVLRNEAIVELYSNMSVKEAFDQGNDVVASAAKGIAEIALTQSDLVSVDIADVCKVIRKSGCAVMGVASAEGDNRAAEAVKTAVLSPLFGGASIAGAKKVLINFATSSSDTLRIIEVENALKQVQELASDTDENGNIHETNVIWGTSVKPELGDKLEVIIVVTGFPSDYYSEALVTPQRQPQIEKPSVGSGIIPPAPTPIVEKKAVPVVAPPQPNLPSIIGKSTRSYADVHLRKAVPAYKTRRVDFITQMTVKGKRVAGKEDVAIEVEQQPTEEQKSIF